MQIGNIMQAVVSEQLAVHHWSDSLQAVGKKMQIYLRAKQEINNYGKSLKDRQKNSKTRLIYYTMSLKLIHALILSARDFV